MKNILSILFLVISIGNATAQKVNVESSSLETNDGYNAAFAVSIPHASLKTVERKWSDFLKDNNAKVKSSKSEMNGKNAIIKNIGPDTLQIYSKIDEVVEGVSLTVAVSKRGSYIAPATFPADAKMMERILKDFATPIAKDALDNKISVASKLLGVKMLDLEDMHRRDKRLASDIEKMKVRISENERERKDLEKQMEELSKDVEGKKTGLESIKNMAKDLE